MSRTASIALLLVLGRSPAAAADPEPAAQTDPQGASVAGSCDEAPPARIGFLGPSRAVTHSLSASRDTAALQMVIAPRPILTGGGEFSLLSAPVAGTTWRLGFYGLIELESKNALPDVKLIAGDIHFWRGSYGFSLAASLDRLAGRWLGRGSALELAFSFRHESEHETEKGDTSSEYRDVRIIGDFLMPDAAAVWRLGELSLLARLQWKIFVGDRAYTHGPGADLTARWHLFPRLQPFASFFTERVFGRPEERVPDYYLVRGLLGVLLPARIGHLSLFLSGDVGHRKGLAVYTREATLAVGVRVAFF